MREIGSGNVLLEIEEYRADVVLNRPDKRNAMNEALLDDLLMALKEVDNTDDVRAMTLTGKGPVFCAGMDLEMMRERGERDNPSLDTGLEDVTEYLGNMTIPTVTSIKRAGLAGAFELVLPVDFRVISKDADFGLLEVKIGLFPSGGASSRLPRLVGLSKAKELVLTGDQIDPQEAKNCGLVHEVVEDPEETDDRTRAWADKITTNAPLAVESANEMLDSTLDMPLDKSIRLEQVLGEELMSSDDYTEGFTARIEGREPEFKGE
jgi:enoyl-CoA hydratase/carnithine racemase